MHIIVMSSNFSASPTKSSTALLTLLRISSGLPSALVVKFFNIDNRNQLRFNGFIHFSGNITKGGVGDSKRIRSTVILETEIHFSLLMLVQHGRD